ncbi:type II toxin-antitoxin system HicB family antitoxin [Acinetobacter pittii]|uniref:type II toxin-antitoxin system HicB family antitoxin n=1 Tax=Acinetobacter calcoaceticus/baumannii complex TaxID=909768 RepID=UPI003261773B
METMRYKNFDGSIETSFEDRIMFGKILFINDLIMYEGNTIDELEESFHKAVDEYIEFCAQNDKQPDKPMNGIFNVRISPELHKKLSLKALQNDCSINACVTAAIDQYVNSNHHIEQSITSVSKTLVSLSQRVDNLVTVDHLQSYTLLNIDQMEYMPSTSRINTKLRVV